jgi:mono/diheme cytochrome c family protein
MKYPLPTSSFLMAVAALAASVACGPSSTDSLLGDDLTGNGGTGGTGGGNWGNGGGGPAYNADGGAQAPVTAKLFAALLPDLQKKCGSCHVDGNNGGGYKWLATPDEYASIKAYPGIVTEDIYSSKLLNRPNNHPTATLVDVGNEALKDAVTTWLSAEAVALKQAPLPTTDVTDVSTGTVDLTKAGIAGGKITFTTSVLATSLRFANVVVVAPSTTGIHIVAPSFVMVPTTGPEVVDTTFSTVDISVPAGGTATIGALFYFFNWTSGSKVRVQFQKIEKATVSGDAGASSGCKDVTTFQNSAAPTLISTCVSCHGGGNGNATAALDLSKLSGTPDYGAACTQAHFKLNLANKAQSNLLLAPLNGSGLNHPVKPFASTASGGYTSLLTWINKE